MVPEKGERLTHPCLSRWQSWIPGSAARPRDDSDERENEDGQDKPGHDHKKSGSLYLNHPFSRSTVSRQSVSDPAKERRM